MYIMTRFKIAILALFLSVGTVYATDLCTRFPSGTPLVCYTPTSPQPIDLSSVLKLNQTTPQTVVNGTPVFDGGIVSNGLATTYTIGDVVTLTNSQVDYSIGNYPADGYTHYIRIYAYKNAGAGRVYSTTPLDANLTDDGRGGVCQFYYEWTPVAGADGYRILKAGGDLSMNYDYYKDVVGFNLFYDIGDNI